MLCSADPIEYWLKQCGAVENRHTCRHLLSDEFIAAGRRAEITPELIFSSTIFPWCHKNNYALHVDALSLPVRERGEREEWESSRFRKV